MGEEGWIRPLHPALQNMETRENALKVAVMQSFKRWLLLNLAEEKEETQEKSIFAILINKPHLAFGQRMKKGNGSR